MSYISWREKNEDKYLKQLPVDPVVPCLRETAHDKEFAIVSNFVADQIVKKEGMNLASFPIIFSEYLFEEYNVTPADVEIMCQVIYRLLATTVQNASEATAQAITDVMMNHQNEEEKYESSGENPG